MVVLFFTKLIGISGSDFDEGYVLSDFRYILLRYGYFGFFIIVLCSMKISFGENSFLYGLCVFLFFVERRPIRQRAKKSPQAAI